MYKIKERFIVDNKKNDYLDIEKSYIGDEMILYLSGRLDTQTSPEFQVYFDDCIDDEFDKLTLDFGELDYLSSAGLRVILYVQKKLKSLDKKCDLSIVNVSDSVMEIFDMTGFTDLINISKNRI